MSAKTATARPDTSKPPKKGSLHHVVQVHYLFTLPILIMYLVFFIVPMFMGIFYSFTDWSGLSSQFNFVGFDNYGKIFQDDDFLNALLFNLKYTVALVIGTLVISLILALLMNQKIPFRTGFRSIFFFPAVLSGITVGLIWNELFLKVVPVFGQTLGIDVLSKSMLGNATTAFWAILIVNLWQGCATPTVLLIAGLQSVPKDLYEAATIDGANAWQRFKAITVPFLLPIINIVIITTTKAGLTIFDYIKALTDGGPNKATRAVGLLIYNDAMQGGKFSYAVAESMILFILVAIVSFFTIKGTSNKEAGDA